MRTELRSRRGCRACRERRRKCDETHPACKACLKRSIVCDYPEMNILFENGAQQLEKKRRRKTRKFRQSPNEDSPETHETVHSPERTTPSSGHGQDQFPISDDQWPVLASDVVEPDQHLTESTATDLYPPSERLQISDDEGSEGWILDNRHLHEISGVHFLTGEDIAYTFFLNHLSSIMQASETNGNAYRKLSVMALNLPTLRDTIISCATEYMHCQGRVPTYINILRRQKAIQSLQQALADFSAQTSDSDRRVLLQKQDQQQSNDLVSPAEDLLAAILLQVANVSFGGGTPQPHVTAAFQLFDSLGYVRQEVTGFVQRLLVHRFAMIEIVASIFQRRRPLLQSTFWLFNIEHPHDEGEISLRQMTGCPQKVLSFLAQVSHLYADTAGKQCLAEDDWERAESLEINLRSYGQALRAECSKAFGVEGENIPGESRQEGYSSSPESEHFMLIKVNWCWYLATVLILQRRIFKDAVSSNRVQQTVARMIRVIKTIPPTSSIGSSIPFPFFLMSREILRKEDQEWVRHYHQECLAFYANPVRRALFDLTEKIWDLRRQRCSTNENMDAGYEHEVELLEKQSGIIIF